MQEAGCARRTVIVIGDTHTGSGSAQIAVWAAGMFETPLGTLPVDAQIAQALVEADPRIQFDQQAFRGEHPVENQLPFIQAVCPDVQIVPVVIRQPSLENAQLLANALLAAVEDHPAPEVLIVASTDLSHYHTYEEARQMDEIALQAILSLDPQVVADSPKRCAELGLGGSNPLTMCSQGAVMTALVAARQMGADQATVLHYANSGDVPIGDRSQVVGYGAVALWQASNPSANQPVEFALPPPLSRPAEPLRLTHKAQEQLLALARDSARQFLATETFPFFHSDDAALLQPLGAYVTYRKAGELRGCVGRLEGDRPAYLNVQYAAVAAALIDNRFPPVTPEELDELSLEITLLQPMRRVSKPSEMQIGRDGILMRVGENGGALFLPQVPLDEGWDLETTLVHLCRKAGLPDDAWKRADAQFYVFAGEWFGEQE
jgi:AmmeMemoRadiSam system protein B/AmmeMemoRadiSam system protein A